MTPVVGVLALQGDVREHVHALQACGARAVPVRRASELAGVDGVVIPGGESTTMSRLLDVFELREPLTAALAGGLPAYGSCAGMILLAREVLDTRSHGAGSRVRGTDRLARGLGALDVTVRRNAFGRQTESFETDLDFAGITDLPGAAPLRAVFIRAPWVERAGRGVIVLAAVPPDLAPGDGDPAGQTAGRIVAVRQGDVLATSFHPEVTGDHRVHQYFVDMIKEGSAR